MESRVLDPLSQRHRGRHRRMLRPLYRMGIRERFETTDDEARAIAWRQWYGTRTRRSADGVHSVKAGTCRGDHRPFTRKHHRIAATANPAGRLVPPPLNPGR